MIAVSLWLLLLQDHRMAHILAEILLQVGLYPSYQILPKCHYSPSDSKTAMAQPCTTMQTCRLSYKPHKLGDELSQTLLDPPPTSRHLHRRHYPCPCHYHLHFFHCRNHLPLTQVLTNGHGYCVIIFIIGTIFTANLLCMAVPSSLLEPSLDRDKTQCPASTILFLCFSSFHHH